MIVFVFPSNSPNQSFQVSRDSSSLNLNGGFDVGPTRAAT